MKLANRASYDILAYFPLSSKITGEVNKDKPYFPLITLKKVGYL